MASPSNDPSAPRGLKRKHDGNAPRLTPSQRLAAARRAGIETSVDPARLGNDDIKSKPVAEPTAARDADDNGHDSATLSAKKKALREDGDYERLYASELDFEALGKEDGDFGALLTAGKHLDFTDPAAMVQLTKTLLKRDFGVGIELAKDRLCPPVPNRHNYILWLKSLLDTSSSTYADAYEPERKVMGLDVGTGASAIYPLLGCAQRPSWSFIATDIDAKSLSWAQRNVALNELESRIRVVDREDSSASLIPDLDELDTPQLDFVMTNPPFYESEAELRDLAAQKALPPASACTGAPHEMVCDGGEVGFIQRLLDESLVLRERVQWYTAMVGKQSSLGVVVDRLRAQGIDNYAVAQFVQGHKTRRWAVGWSFGARRPAGRACRGGGLVGGTLADGNGKSLLPQVTEMTVASRTVRTPAAASQLENTFWTQLEDVTDGLDLVAWSLDEERLRGVGFTNGNVWGRAYRRQKRRATAPMDNGEEEFKGNEEGKKKEEEQKKEKGQGGTAIGDRTKTKKEPAECPFGFSVSIQTNGKLNTEGVPVHEVTAVVRWLQGTDFGLFESFCGMLRSGLLAVTIGTS
ncbi:23S rRNA (adenine(1618)-N(6))-methyltransferase [Apiospora saccharicola]|uniref:23S rRNA (Adenine(1618)-N(6))-methyltransferase n=1 Tax=Apiospora saccharicola TaxID=335842 RepID=A0ABR1UPH4_9PEZI